MRKNILFALLLGIFGQFATAQFIAVESTKLLKFNDNSAYFYPRFSPAGDYLLVSSSNYQGLKSYDFTTKTMTSITEDAGAGYNTQISTDGKSILYSKTVFVKNLRNNSLVQVEKATRSKKQLSAVSRETLTPHFATNAPTYVVGKKLVRPNVTKAETKPIITIEDRKMVLYTAESRKELIPNGADASYIWPVISPDGQKIAYTVMGKNTFVCNINGKEAVSVGYINAPQWLNNNWLIGMNDKDEGGRIISSDLIAVSSDGKKQQKIAIPDGKMALYPAADIEGKRIAFSTEKGELYILSITLK
jgi:Tol biopolymer transport system component